MAYTDIDKPSDYFNTKIWTGDGDTASNKTGVGFKPDWTWIKKRTNDVEDHALFDSVRGVASAKLLNSNANGGEETHGNNGYVSGFLSDGFSVATNGSNSEKWEYLNTTNDTYVSWNWKGSGSASANSDGSTASSVSANTTAGFSVVGYTGAGATTYGHGLGATPNVIIIKKRTSDSGNNNWFVYHDKVITAGGSNKSFLTLNETDALGANGSATTFTSVSSTTFGVGTDDIISESSHTFIAYCFAEVKGYSKFGSYTGNATGGNEGPFIYTGFKPAWVMIKNASAGSTDWLIYDNKRGGPAATVYGNNNKFFLKANENDAEANETFDMYSNGFKIRITNNFLNGDGNTLIYMAFAESPFVSSNKIPTNAR